MPHTHPVAQESDHSPAGEAARFVLRLGHALHSYGYAAHELEDVLGRVARALGMEAQFFSAPTSIIAAFGPQDDQRTHLIRVEPGEVHLGKLARLHEVTEAVLAGRLAPADGSARIQAISTASARYPGWLSLPAFGLVSGAATRFLGGGWKEIAISTGIGLAIGGLASGVRRVRDAPRVFEPVAALLASAIATLSAAAFPPLSVYVTTLGGLIALIPGLTLTVALTELSTGNLQSGTARLSGATVVFLAIAFGVAVGGRLVETAIGALPPMPEALAPPGWTIAAALFLAPLSFAVLFQAEPRDVPGILLIGPLGYFGGVLGAQLLGPQLGVFLGALTVGLAGNLHARALKRPAAVTQVPGLLLLVPGSVGFRSLASMLDNEVVRAVEAAFAMALTAVALVAGLLVANLLLPSGARRPAGAPSGPPRP